MKFESELWVEYTLGICTFLLRFFSRWKVVGFRNFAGDDFFSFIAMLLWISDGIIAYTIDRKGTFVGLTASTADELSDAQVHDFTVGSKALFVAWLTYTSLIWSLKASLLFFYYRLTLPLARQTLVQVISVTCIIAYIACLLVLFLHCTPIQRNWQIKPYAGDECTLTVLNYIFVATANVSTDAAILAITVPLIYSIRVAIRHKIIIAIVLCSGVFIMIAAILRCVLSLKTDGSLEISLIWGIRETFVSVLAVSATGIKPLFSKSRKRTSPDAGSTPRSGEQPSFVQRHDEFRGIARRRELSLIVAEGSGAGGGVDGSKVQKDLERGEGYNIEMLVQSRVLSTLSSPADEMVHFFRGHSTEWMLNQGDILCT